MDTILPIILAMLGGMICGATLIALGVTFYLRMQSLSVKPIQPEAETFLERPRGFDIGLKRSSDVQAPPVPVQRAAPQPMPDAFSTLAGSQVSISSYPFLDGLSGVVAGQRIQLQREENILGRSRVCDVQIHDPKVSRQHAMLRLYKGNYFIQDMQSSRGTIVNNQPVQSHLLKDGDQLRMGDSVLVFRLPPS